MEKIIDDWSIKVKVTGEEAKEICKLGQEEKCCAFLVCGRAGFECWRLNYPSNSALFAKIKDGTMSAKGMGGWPGCAFEGEL